MMMLWQSLEGQFLWKNWMDLDFPKLIATVTMRTIPDIGWETADEYLSGNVRDKLRVAKAVAADTDNPQAERFVGNVAALEKVQPEWIEASD